MILLFRSIFVVWSLVAETRLMTGWHKSRPLHTQCSAFQHGGRNVKFRLKRLDQLLKTKGEITERRA